MCQLIRKILMVMIVVCVGFYLVMIFGFDKCIKFIFKFDLFILQFLSECSVRASRGAVLTGLGKRLLQDEPVGRRSGAPRYSFGLGR